ncbi:hypothetical protein [Clostridium cochlearium]|uniref:hypothetical protein n=1 Tax=Clostridium cochlearium TaxID=1494 RepID=UPI00167406F5|nr:hypothetical protein [Clostridium cochlearium]
MKRLKVNSSKPINVSISTDSILKGIKVATHNNEFVIIKTKTTDRRCFRVNIVSPPFY